MSTGKSANCPECGQAASGNFCHNCGSGLGGRFCNQCGGALGAGVKFCGECGTGVGVGAQKPAGPARRAVAAEVVGGNNLPWWIAGVSMFALIFILGLRMVSPGGPPAPAATVPQAVAGTPPDISNMTPIEAADRLFGRVMESISEGDSAVAQQFMPMAIAAYQRARPLNLDGLFHLSMLNRTAMNLEAALDNALEIVEQDPSHLLGLAAAAEAAIELGEEDEAEIHYRRIAEIYDVEVERPLEEYDAHRAIVVALKQDAERFLAGR